MSPKQVNFNLFSYETLFHALAGSVGSITAMTAFYPLDTMRSRLQLEDRESKSTWSLMAELVKKEGVETLYRGIFPVLKSLWISNFVYFYIFHGLKSFKGGGKSENAARDLFLATIAGVMNVLTTTPLWVVSTRLKMKGVNNQEKIDYQGLTDGICKITRDEGVQSLWSGTVPSLFLVSNPAIQFTVYEALKRQIHKFYPDKKLGAFEFFLIGATAKAVATVVTYPLQLVQAKLRHGHKYPDLKQNANTKEITMYIVKKYGIWGLFKGMEPKILQTVLTAALMFATYEKIFNFVFKIMRTKYK